MNPILSEEVTAIRAKLQDLLARAQERLGEDHEFCGNLGSADDFLGDAENDPCIPLDAEDEDSEE
jgi:hypothetical protein